MKKLFLLVAIAFCVSTYVSAQQIGGRVDIAVILGNRPPTPSENQLLVREERAHPNITQSMRDIHDAMDHLRDAPDNFGGHKAQAMADLRQSYISLRKALYFRIYDDRH